VSLIKVRAALEQAVAAMPGIVLPVTIVASTASSTAAVFETATPHLLESGVTVGISGHSEVLLDGTYYFVKLTDTTFSLQNKVTKTPIASTASGTGGVLTPKLIAWEGVAFEPVAGVPYQKVNVLYATPINSTLGTSHYREHGYLQVSLYYPTNMGTVDVVTRAELIRSTFPRGASFSNGGVVVNIDKTPAILPGLVESETFAMAVMIPYRAEIFN
jgi:hypothetical protein